MALFTVSFYAPSLRRTVPCDIVMPTDKCLRGSTEYSDEGPYRVLYMLHGVFGSSHDWICNTRLRVLAQKHNLCVVMPSGDNKCYADSVLTGDLYGDFITKDLISFVEGTFNVSRRRQDRFIGGLSMGGFGAVTNALRNPGLYSKVLSYSGAMIKGLILNSGPDHSKDLFSDREYCAMFGLSRKEDFEGCEADYEMLARRAADAPVKPEFWMSCGLSDRMYPWNADYKDLLISLGYHVSWNDWAGDHNWQFWDESLERSLAFLELGDAQQGVSSGNVH